MQNPIKRIKKWMHWRGVTLKDALYATFSLGFLITAITVLGVASCHAEGWL